MNGTAHLLIGTGIGFAAAVQHSSPPAEAALFITVGAISGLMPDMDVNGRLSNRITFSHQLFKHVAKLIGSLMIIYSFLMEAGSERWLGIGIGTAILLISTRITQRRMLTLTGAGLLLGGISLQELWILLTGVYIIVASFIPHRSYTHSMIGVVFLAGLQPCLNRRLASMACSRPLLLPIQDIFLLI